MSRAIERNKGKQLVENKPSTSSAGVSLLAEDQILEDYRTSILSLALTYLAKIKTA